MIAPTDRPPYRVVCEPEYLAGSPRLSGTRLNCDTIVKWAAAGFRSLLSYLDGASETDVMMVLEYCASQRCKDDVPRCRAEGRKAHYCSGCANDSHDQGDLNRRNPVWILATSILSNPHRESNRRQRKRVRRSQKER